MKNNDLHIKSYCKIRNGKVIFDDKVLYDTHQPDFNIASKSIYKHFEINYPKFYKMDPLSKLSFLTASILITNNEQLITEDTALVLSNKSSCLDIDFKHQATINDKDAFYPSPANFVYTLPNISIGEISIKYKLKSENSFFIFEKFRPDFLVTYSKTLFGVSTNVICGWVEVFNGKHDAFLYLLDQKGTTENNKENVLKLYNK